ncbi:alkaline ceramidase 3-like [Centruroides sculpturatus]|uniref:alkaline ceramidase 3-like n=1 Tax=Centruroides sculpturatus TaxID=218467 RepID=UPI000C6D456A|nr:alkaline ceramidase 3-like [Centruroides sculpturatus]XP_023225097.1 alkaline ceramidase 3-like [Centruroides sculpturatus]
MAPTSANGFWGKPTATLDWCERNYEVTFYIAEFWNTLSNLAMLLPAIWGGWQAWKDGLELRFLLSHFFLLVVGCGSWWFHMTLQYGMQLFDELPMVWGSLILVYALAEVNSPPKKRNVPLIIGLILYGLVVTIVSNSLITDHEMKYYHIKNIVNLEKCF